VADDEPYHNGPKAIEDGSATIGRLGNHMKTGVTTHYVCILFYLPLCTLLLPLPPPALPVGRSQFHPSSSLLPPSTTFYIQSSSSPQHPTTLKPNSAYTSVSRAPHRKLPDIVFRFLREVGMMNKSCGFLFLVSDWIYLGVELLGWFQWSPDCISLLSMTRQFSLSHPLRFQQQNAASKL
jgi:hypothetical protein